MALLNAATCCGPEATVTVAEHARALVIGKGGETIRKMEGREGIRRVKLDGSQLTVRGARDAVNALCAEVQGYLSQFVEQSVPIAADAKARGLSAAQAKALQDQQKAVETALYSSHRVSKFCKRADSDSIFWEKDAAHPFEDDNNGDELPPPEWRCGCCGKRKVPGLIVLCPACGTAKPAQ